ncbi:hypothetical protein, conserved [Babesia ovata]|uniref:Uncharacterized protein n=1 Tax=Babesia ovata TaxID=189622 RepID=A0A2H6KFS8_9APIC|nr:uncharacterized protein BOVATA_033390 [Babesia ovata]GBE61846.1 hypothetical protein, conserved [Babesia ovata]
MASQRDEREMKASPGGDPSSDLASRVSVGGDKDGEDDRRTDKLEQVKEWKNRLDEFMSYTHTVLNDVLGDTRPDATSELSSRPVNSPSGNGGSCCSPQQHTLGADPPSIQSSSQTAQKIDGGPKCACKSPNITNVDKAAYHALTEPPRNVKECMDWLIALKGKDPEKNLKALGEAVYKFLADKPVGKMQVPALENVKLISKEFLQQPKLKYWRPSQRVLRRLNLPSDEKPGGSVRRQLRYRRSDYENVIQTMGAKPEDIAEELADVVSGCEKFLKCIKNPGQYKSAYCPEATWDASFANDTEACAVILVGIGPMLYAGTRSLIEAWLDAFWRCPPFIAYNRMRELVKVLGFVEPECRASPRTSDVDKALCRLDDNELYTVYDLSGFWAFY